MSNSSFKSLEEHDSSSRSSTPPSPQSSLRNGSIKKDSATSIGSYLVDKQTSSGSSLKDKSSKKQKIRLIKKALKQDPVDIATLRQLAISNQGLVNNELRREAWPKLLNTNVFNIQSKSGNYKKHHDYEQVILDVNRCLRRFPPGMKEDQKMVLQEQLVGVIMRVLVKHPELHYYQGYHDICITFLLVCGEDIAFALVDTLSTNHLRDFMDVSMDRTKHTLNYIYPIMAKANSGLTEFMLRSEVGNVFCLSWLITWFGHVLNEFRHVVRLYDFFIACHPLMPIYLAAAIVLYREEDILSSECEMCFLHGLLSKIPEDLPYEHLISRAGELFVQYPPEKLASEAKLQYGKSSAIANYRKFQKSTANQRPDSVLRKLKQEQVSIAPLPIDNRSSWVIKATLVSLYFLTIAIAFAVHHVATEWNSE